MDDGFNLTPVQVVQAQMDAFNRHDLEGYLAYVNEDIVLEEARGSIVLIGRHALAPIISGLWAEHPDLRMDLLDRMALGQWVVDETIMLGRIDNSSTHLISIQRVIDGQVESVRTIRDSPPNDDPPE
jgi:hypothetical protein